MPRKPIFCGPTTNEQTILWRSFSAMAIDSVVFASLMDC